MTYRWLYSKSTSFNDFYLGETGELRLQTWSRRRYFRVVIFFLTEWWVKVRDTEEINDSIFFGCNKADLYTLSVTITRCFSRVLLIGIAYHFSICE